MLVGSGYSANADPATTIKAIQKLIDEGNKVLINYDIMAIGGMGGYIDIYVKPNN